MEEYCIIQIVQLLKMNKKLLTFGIIGFFLVSLVSAGLISISVWDKDISLDKITTDRIKEVADIPSINVEIGKIQCDNTNCWATLFQEDLIQTEWRRSINYCSEFNKTLNEFNETTNECLTYTDYTLTENKQAIQDYLEKRLDDWSIVEEARQNKVVEDKTDKGVIKEKTIVDIRK